MCNGFSSRISQGGSIAVLRPTKSFPSICLGAGEELRLLFSNQSGDDSTQVEFRGWEGKRRMWENGYWVVIHRDGDLNAPASKSAINQTTANPFLSFSLEKHATSITQLRQRLDLRVGDSGIIGRKVSVMTSSIEGPMAVAEGIVGWN
ncbi:hypothetical protein K505DRAFT_322852 [Melanomma pulvis-pyrius CBS 109.77]|uniref:Uncharacterized protein n=1 Tax=Melanomma pulvis-pyrius CBS 109.77 TaxID=1314802 RepID=A0A6A6XLU4_9PLEO|nr:hypothetical protein K505DRAFT_322852 [Melanomma pulvis-pyrius CBS 109.77]